VRRRVDLAESVSNRQTAVYEERTRSADTVKYKERNNAWYVMRIQARSFVDSFPVDHGRENVANVN